MAAQFNVLILHCKKDLNGLKDVVSAVDWSMEARDGDFVARVMANTEVGDPNPKNFVNFANLTPAIIEAWVQNTAAQHYADVKAQAEAELAAQKAMPIVTPNLPWGQPPESASA